MSLSGAPVIRREEARRIANLWRLPYECYGDDPLAEFGVRDVLDADACVEALSEIEVSVDRLVYDGRAKREINALFDYIVEAS